MACSSKPAAAASQLQQHIHQSPAPQRPMQKQAASLAMHTHRQLSSHCIIKRQDCPRQCALAIGCDTPWDSKKLQSSHRQSQLLHAAKVLRPRNLAVWLALHHSGARTHPLCTWAASVPQHRPKTLHMHSCTGLSIHKGSCRELGLVFPLACMHGGEPTFSHQQHTQGGAALWCSFREPTPYIHSRPLETGRIMGKGKHDYHAIAGCALCPALLLLMCNHNNKRNTLHAREHS